MGVEMMVMSIEDGEVKKVEGERFSRRTPALSWRSCSEGRRAEEHQNSVHDVSIAESEQTSL